MLVIATYSAVGPQSKKKTEYYEVVNMFETHAVTEYKLNLSSGALEYKLKDDETVYRYTVPNVSLFVDDIHDDVVEYNKENPDSQIKMDYASGTANSWWVSLLPTVVMILLLAGVMFFMFKRMNQSVQSENNRAMSFGKARYKKNDDKNKTTFADVAGADEEKEELEEIVEFLKSPKDFSALGARIPKGVLLVGPPGTGKTLLARAVAGEAGAPFFSISGSDFVEMYVGVGASRVRDLFAEAKKNAPSIIFIDEIDAVGRHRGAGMGGGHDEREQTLNQLLVEMDGFGPNEGVIVIAATNRPDILDPALLRPGRFDRQVTVNYPDLKGREEILKVHARHKPLGPDVNLRNIAGATVGFTGADLENLLNEAALLAARRKLKAITMKEIEEATMKVVVGTEKKSHKISEKDKKITAYHEAGHAVTSFYLEHEDPVTHISIVPRGMAGGFTMYQPEHDEMHLMKSKMLDDIVGLLGGRVAEKIIFNDISTGASNDIERASEQARKMVTRYGMSEKLGPIAFGQNNDEVFLGKDYNHMRNYSEAVASQIDDEVEKIILNAYKQTEDILTEHIDKLHAVALELVKREKLTGDEFRRIMNGEELEPLFANEDKDEAKPEAETNSDAKPESEVKSDEAVAPETSENNEASETVDGENTEK
ncbi:MAG: ATP-dependent zinc metalloprotease FtsH [Ruminococcus sp.]|nr:ATP-dependent zinc metalloprotease FtsH [Ruminococcus sp.]MDY4909604.1 ATP-dependent zinc metalloprotease FtsH [Candidatus Fimenecus sp.]